MVGQNVHIVETLTSMMKMAILSELFGLNAWRAHSKSQSASNAVNSGGLMNDHKAPSRIVYHMDGTLARGISGDGEEWMCRDHDGPLLPGSQDVLAGMEGREE